MSQVFNTRTTFYAAREAAERARASLTQARAQLSAVLRAHGTGSPEFDLAHAEESSAGEALAAARKEESAALAEFSEERRRLLGPDIDADVRTLHVAYPIALFPARIETRFETATVPSLLRVRIYPDEALADSFEPALMPRELEAGRQFWRAGWKPRDEEAAWSSLVASFGAPRAAWIVTATTPWNADMRGTAEPVFLPPGVGIRTHAWTRAVEAKLLPDRWTVLAYRDGRVVRSATGGLVMEPLALTASPDPLAGTLDLTEHGPTITEDAAWTLEYERALRAGMAIDLPLDPTDVALGFDLVLALGVKSTMDPAESSEQLRLLIDSHRFTRGVAFLPQGTRTNNTATAASSYPPPDPGGVNSFNVERRVVPTGDGEAWATALGLDPSSVSHIAGADITEQTRSRAMLHVLWPATLGYFLAQMMDPVFSSEMLRAARAWALTNVRGCGPFPVMRIGTTPYGLLPATSLARWSADAKAVGPDAQLPSALRGLLPYWLAATPSVPRVGRTGDADADLVQTLGVDASTREVRLRCVAGPDLLWNGLAFGGVRARRWLETLRSRAASVLTALGHPAWEPRVAYMSFADWPDRLNLPLVAPHPLGEDGASTPLYIAAIRRASIDELRSGSLPGVGKPSTLLDHMLRYAALREYAEMAFDFNVAAQRLRPDQRREPELVDLTPGEQQRGNTWSLFDVEAPQAAGKLRDVLNFGNGIPGTKDLAEYGHSLDVLSGTSAAELERLFTETLDVCSHRIDAWVTGLARQRLSDMRASNRSGVHLGGYAWVENLRPAGDVAPNGGFIHAPSLDQATAAAVLRNAFLSRAGERDAEGSPRRRYAIDLSSRRVRTSLELLDEVRQGQPLGAVLGYRIERTLHDHIPPLDRYFSPLRNLYPLVALKDSGGIPPPGASAESVAARNVIDGLALWIDWRRVRANEADRRAFFARPGLPSAESGDAAALANAFDAIIELLDAVADLLTAESVHQAIRGNMSAASASLDSIARGARPPDPEIIKTRRTGVILTHRVALILGGDDPPAASSWTGLSTPRAAAEPFLDAFASRLLGHPSDIRCIVTYRLAGSPGTSQMTLTLADVMRTTRLEDAPGRSLRAIDLLAMARTTPVGSYPRELELRVADAVRDRQPNATDISIADDRGAPTPVRALSDALGVARALNAALGTARPLRREDLRLSEETLISEAVDRTATHFSPVTLSRVMAARDAQRTLTADLAEQLRFAADAMVDATPTMATLKRAAQFGISQAYPEPALAAAERRADLLALGQTVQAELTRRQARASAAGDPADIARAVFGDDFILLTSFQPDNAAELERGRAVSIDLSVDDRLPVQTWFQRSARVRPALARWRMLSLYSAALGVRADDFTISQLPAGSLARWAALRFPTDNDRPKALTLSLALHEPFGSPPPDARWTGMLLDSWPELIPDPVNTTGVAFHYDDPGAEAAQALLLAVPPDPAAGWSLDALAAVVKETLDLAKVRLVDGELLNAVCQFLPAIYLADNARGETIVADLSEVLVREGPT